MLLEEELLEELEEELSELLVTDELEDELEDELSELLVTYEFEELAALCDVLFPLEELPECELSPEPPPYQSCFEYVVCSSYCSAGTSSNINAWISPFASSIL